jgi:hypothetical protein
VARSPLFDIYDPYGFLQQQAELGLLPPSDDDELDVVGIAPLGQQRATIADLMPREEQSGLLSSLAKAGSSGMAAAGWLFDTPGALVRGVLAGKPLSFLGTSDERVTGRELLRQYGMIGDQDTWGNFAGGLAAEVLLDPLTLMNPMAIFGRGALTQTGKAMKATGLLRNAAEQAWEGSAVGAGREAGRGVRSYMRSITPQQAIAEIADPTARADALARWQRQAERFGVDPTDMTGTAASMMDVRIPGTNIGFNTDVFGERFGDWAAEGLDWLGEQSKRNPYTGPLVNTLYAGFHAPSGGTLNPDLQWDSRIAKMHASRADEARELLRQRQLREALGVDAEAVAARERARGTANVPASIPESLRRFNSTDVQRALVDYVESSSVPLAPGVYGPMPKTSGDPLADWVLQNVDEFRGVRDTYMTAVDEARQRAANSGLPDRDWRGSSGTDFFPRQLKWFERIMDPVRPNAQPRVEQPWGRSQTLLDTADNFGRRRRDYTDIPGGQRTFRLLTGGRALQAAPGTPSGLPFDAADLQRRLIAADQIPARQLLDDAFDQLGITRPFREDISNLQVSPKYLNATVPEQQQMMQEALRSLQERQDKLVNIIRGADQQFAQTGTGIFDTPGWTNLSRYERGQSRVLANAERLIPRLENATTVIGAGGLSDGMVQLTDAAQRLGFDSDNFRQMWRRRFQADITNLSVPERLVKQMETVVKSSQAGDAERGMVGLLDGFTNAFKVGALASPAFHTRNTYSGLLNAATFGAANPLDWWAALRASMGSTDALASRLENVPGFENLQPAQRVARFQDLTAANRIGGGNILDDISGLPEQQIRGGWLGAGNEQNVGRAFYDPNRTRGGFANDFFSMRGVGILDRAPTRNRNPFLVLNDAIGSTSEDALRGGVFLNQLRKGVDPGEAADLVRLSQVDYSPQAFTSFERNILKRALPFYSFQKGIVPSIVNNTLYRPGGLMGQSIRGVTRGTEPSEENFIPEHMRQSAAIPLPPEWGGGNPGLQRYLTNIDLPWESTFQLFSPGVGATTSSQIADTIRKTGSNILGMTNPIIKAPLEYFTNRQLYSGRDLTDLYSVLERDFGEIGRPLEQVATNFVPFGTRALGLYRQLTDDRLGTADKYTKAAWNLLAGAKLTDIDQDRAKRQAARDMLNAILETTPGVRTYENITVPEDVLRGMPKEQRDMYLLYKIIQSTAAKQAREKKKQQAALDPLQMLGVLNQF